VPSPHLLCAGEAFEDLIFAGLDRLPNPGEELRTSRFTATIGGGAVITAVAAARLGMKVTVMSGLAPAAEARLKQEGVKTVNLRKADEPHAISAALSTTGQRTFVTFDGVNTNLEPRLANALVTARATHAHLAFYPRNCAAWATRVQTLRDRGITTSWDFGWNDRLAEDRALPALIDAVDVVFVNEQEAPLYAAATTLEASLPFWRARRSIVVIKLGQQGSMTLGNEGEWEVRAPRVQAVDTTGAGDAFNAGLAVALAEGRTLEHAVKFANCSGALACTALGVIPGLPSRAAVDELYRKTYA
jgi:sugar/nucleoside kinase (ribokinase family)